MTITYSGTRSYDPDSACVRYQACVDGVDIECWVNEDFLRGYFEDMGDPLATFDSCRLAILDFTKETIRGEGVPVESRIRIEPRSASD